MTLYFIQAFIYLCAAVIAVPIAKRLGLGSVLGYLIAGVVIGPVLGLVGQETATIQHYAEFGVAMMLFLVGLELEPRILWEMRHRLLGLGGLQVLLTVLLVTGVGLIVGLTWTIALTIGLIFSLSSTAIVLQTFNEKGLNKTDGARNSFSVLLFQDIAVLPMLALIPLMALPDLVEAAQAAAHNVAQSHEEFTLVADLSGWVYGLVVVGTIVALVTAGHFLSHSLFTFVAKTGLREIFTTTALMLVVGTATLMSLLGLSPALGTFLAGVVLATSEFRHELESNIEPFKGLLLGLFFITVGAGINFDVLSANLELVILLAVAVMLVKAGVLYFLAYMFKVNNADRWLVTL
ncbi:MAG: cation:proton antiporter, partial [Algicola sp.]|nr:cation:proton antiporter [Algicola sp.]